MAKRGSTAMGHARAVIETKPGVVVQYSGQRLQRIPDDTKEDGFRYMAREEDIFNGCFDAAVIQPPEPTLLVQVTTLKDGKTSGANHRMRKIEREFLSRLLGRRPRERIQIWGWVNGQGFRRWHWHHGAQAWVELEMLDSPKLKKRTKERAA